MSVFLQREVQGEKRTTKKRRGPTGEAIDTRRDGAFVRKITRYAALVLRTRLADMGRMIDQTVFGCVAFRFQGARVKNVR